MHPFHAASFLSATPAEGSLDFEPRQQQEEEELGGAASPQSRGTRAGGENAGVIRCQDRRHRRTAKAHCCSDRGGFVVCPGHVNTSDVPASQRSKRQQQTLAASSASAAAVDVEPIPNKRPCRRPALPSVAAAAPTTTSSVDQPIETTTTALERFAREVRLHAVFRRVRLGGGPNEPEVAYYTTVTIAGHVFRGVLYDVGPHPHSGSSTAASDTDGSGEVGSSLISTAGGSCLDLALGL